MAPSFFKKGDGHSSAFVSKAEETSGPGLSTHETKIWLGINTKKSWYEELATPSFGNRLRTQINKTKYGKPALLFLDKLFADSKLKYAVSKARQASNTISNSFVSNSKLMIMKKHRFPAALLVLTTVTFGFTFSYLNLENHDRISNNRPNLASLNVNISKFKNEIVEHSQLPNSANKEELNEATNNKTYHERPQRLQVQPFKIVDLTEPLLNEDQIIVAFNNAIENFQLSDARMEGDSKNESFVLEPLKLFDVGYVKSNEKSFSIPNSLNSPPVALFFRKISETDENKSTFKIQNPQEGLQATTPQLYSIKLDTIPHPQNFQSPINKSPIKQPPYSFINYTQSWLNELSAPETEDAEWKCLVEALYFEARGEEIMGQFAVAEVILNRVDSSKFPNTICGVVDQGSGRRNACQFSYNCDGVHENMPKNANYERASRIAETMINGGVRQLVGGATYYHSTTVQPFWSSKFYKTTQIGKHKFYTPNRNNTIVFLRPVLREPIVPEEEKKNIPNSSSVLTSKRPKNRPNEIQIQKIAIEQLIQPTEFQSPNGQSNAPTKFAATIKKILGFQEINLIGVAGNDLGRSALVKLFDGEIIKLSIGDNLNGGRVVDISAVTLTYLKSGQSITLTLPKS